MKRFLVLTLLLAAAVGAAQLVGRRAVEAGSLTVAATSASTGGRAANTRCATMSTPTDAAPTTPVLTLDSNMVDPNEIVLRPEFDLRRGRAKVEDLLRAAKLELSEKELQRLVENVVDFEHAEDVIAAPFVKVVAFDRAILTVEIPAHPAEGSAVKTAFHRQLRDDFSSERAEEIIRALEGGIDTLLGDCGKSYRTFHLQYPGGVFCLQTQARTADSLTLSNDWHSRHGLDEKYPWLAATIEQYFPKAVGAAPE